VELELHSSQNDTL